MELNLFLYENQEEEAHCESTNLFAPSSDLLPGGGRQRSNLQIAYADLQFFCSLIIISSTKEVKLICAPQNPRENSAMGSLALTFFLLGFLNPQIGIQCVQSLFMDS